MSNESESKALHVTLKRVPIFRALMFGLVSAVLFVSFDISMAALIFSGDLGNYLLPGIGIFLVSSVIVGTIVPLASSFRAVTATPQEDAAVILAIMASSIAAHLRATNPQLDPLPSIIIAIAISTIATGLSFLLLGILRLGNWARIIPYPVIGGFIAGAGWLLVQGSIPVMTGNPVEMSKLTTLLEKPLLYQVVIGFSFGGMLTLLLRYADHFLILPGLVLSSIGIFYASVVLLGLPMDAIRAQNWLLGPFPTGAMWPPVEPQALANVQWPVLFDNAGNLITIVVMVAFGFFLNASSVELATETEIDLDQELRATGIANLLAGLAGGVAACMTLSESIMSHKAGATTRLTGIISAATCLLVLILGADMLVYLPRPILGGLLVYLGFECLLSTVYEGWSRLRLSEYLIVLAILLIIAIWGFLPGVVVGLIISIGVFAWSYGRIDVIRNAIYGTDLRSNVARTTDEEKLLDRQGRQIHVLQLQGYVFFGTAYRLLTRAKDTILASAEAKLRYLLLDFRHVSGLDSSAVVSFQRLNRLAQSHDVKLIFTEVPQSIQKHLLQTGILSETSEFSRVLPDVDRGLEACENEIIRQGKTKMAPEPMLSRELQDVFDQPKDIVRFLGYLKREEFPPGHDLFRQGEMSKDLYLIESGELTAWLEKKGVKIKRLRTMGPGTVVGESGLYMDAARSATVTTNGSVVLYRLSVDALRHLTSEAPELAAAFHQFVARMLAQRMVHSTAAVKSLFN